MVRKYIYGNYSCKAGKVRKHNLLEIKNGQKVYIWQLFMQSRKGQKTKQLTPKRRVVNHLLQSKNGQKDGNILETSDGQKNVAFTVWSINHITC